MVGGSPNVGCVWGLLAVALNWRHVYHVKATREANDEFLKFWVWVNLSGAKFSRKFWDDRENAEEAVPRSTNKAVSSFHMKSVRVSLQFGI